MIRIIRFHTLFLLTAIAVYMLIITYARADIPVDGVITQCKTTPGFRNLKYKPDAFNTTNNLRRATGSFFTAKGKNIIIYYRLLDKNCTPIQNATIKMWQANYAGLYQYGSPSSKNADLRAELIFDPNFVGSGTATSDNLGRFSFITIKPGRFAGHAPFVNLLITHPDLKPFGTKMYFADSVDNLSDSSLKKIAPELRSRLIAITYSNTKNFDDNAAGELQNNTVYMFDITLNQVIPKTRY